MHGRTEGIRRLSTMRFLVHNKLGIKSFIRVCASECSRSLLHATRIRVHNCVAYTRMLDRRCTIQTSDAILCDEWMKDKEPKPEANDDHKIHRRLSRHLLLRFKIHHIRHIDLDSFSFYSLVNLRLPKRTFPFAHSHYIHVSRATHLWMQGTYSNIGCVTIDFSMTISQHKIQFILNGISLRRVVRYHWKWVRFDSGEWFLAGGLFRVELYLRAQTMEFGCVRRIQNASGEI